MMDDEAAVVVEELVVVSRLLLGDTDLEKGKKRISIMFIHKCLNT